MGTRGQSRKTDVTVAVAQASDCDGLDCGTVSRDRKTWGFKRLLEDRLNNGHEGEKEGRDV